MGLEALLQQGLEFLKNDELEQAIAKFDEVLALDSKNESALLNKGIALYENDDFDKAIENYDVLLEINDKNKEAYFNKANAYAMKYEYTKSIELFTKAIELDENYFEAYINRGLDYLKVKEVVKAGDDFSSVINKGCKDKVAFFNMGRVFTLVADNKNAAFMFDKAIEVDPEYLMAYVRRGEAYIGLQDLEKAEADFNLVLNKAANNYHAKIGVARVNHHRGNHEAALEILNAIDNEKAKLEVFLLKGVIYQNTGESQSAFECYQEVLKEDQTNVLANLNMARLMNSVNNPNRALLHYSMVIKETPEAYPAYSERGNVLYNIRAYKEALMDYEKFLSLMPTDKGVIERKGKCLAMIGRYEEAKDVYRNFMNENPNDVHWIYCYAWACMMGGQVDEALENYNKCTEIKPDYVPAIGDRALIYTRLGENEKAEEGYKQTLELDYKRAENHYNLANFYVQIKRVDDALAILERFTSENESVGRGWYLYGATFRANNQLDKAVEMYDKAIALEPKIIDTNVAKASALVALGKVEEGEKIYEQLIEWYPKSVDVLFMQGRFYIEAKLNEKAVLVLDKAILMNDKNPTGYNIRAYAYRAMGENEKAEHDEKSFEELSKK